MASTSVRKWLVLGAHTSSTFSQRPAPVFRSKVVDLVSTSTILESSLMSPCICMWLPQIQLKLNVQRSSASTF